MASELKHTVKPSGGDFTTLQGAIDHIVASHANLVGADVYALVEIDGTWSSPDTAQVLLSASILTSATCYLSIYTTAAARFDPHGPVWDTGAYILAPNAIASTTAALSLVGVDYVFLDGLQVTTTNPGGSSRHIVVTGATARTDNNNQTRISNCILKGHGHATHTSSVLSLATANLDVCVWNCIGFNSTALGSNRSLYANMSSTGTCKVSNCTFIGGEYAYYRASGAMTIKNCYGGGSLSGDYYGTMTKTTCASSDTTGDTGLQSIPVSAATFVNVTPGSEDFHLAAGSALIGVGTDTSGDAAPMNFTTDIDGDSRV
jgi:hypothetical protein